jgi:hypothetical protein
MLLGWPHLQGWGRLFLMVAGGLIRANAFDLMRGIVLDLGLTFASFFAPLREVHFREVAKILASQPS